LAGEICPAGVGVEEQFGNTITEQMRREGASSIGARRFTMDASLSLAVRNVF